MTARKRFLTEFPAAVADDAGAAFIGAGVSVGAGYPTWRGLLHDIADELGVRSNDVQDLAALAQWSIRKSAGRTRIQRVLRDQIAVQRPIPSALEVVARLPIRNIWTTNYDTLIERAFAEIGRPVDEASCAEDLSVRSRPGAARLFKMHGTIGRLDDLVIATEDYELYRKKRAAFLPLLQAHLTSFSMLFLGLSFTDPNIRHVLSTIVESFSGNPPEHFAIVRPPQRDEYDSVEEFQSRHIQHKHWSEDLLRYGLQVVEIDDYAEVPELLRLVERRVASRRVWVSGSWPPDHAGSGELAAISTAIGRSLGAAGFTLVSGSGLTIAQATLAGFLGALQRAGTWDLERRLLVRPFVQPTGDAEPDREQWAALRQEMARASGATIFVGGAKLAGGALIDADGVFAERDASERVGGFLLPIGSTGGAAEKIAQALLGSEVPSKGAEARRPTDAELKRLMATRDPEQVASDVLAILRRHAGR